MANNFVNSFASIPTAGEFYQSTGSATDNHTGPQNVYTANNLDEFIALSIKIVMQGTNTSEPPRIKDLRAIALAT